MKDATLRIVGYGEDAAIVVPRPLLEVFGFEIGDQVKVPLDKCGRVPKASSEESANPEYRGILGGKPVAITRSQVLEHLDKIKGQVIRSPRNYYIVHGGVEIPPKLIVGDLTGVDLSLFNSVSAKGVLAKLGFDVQYKG